MSLQRIEFKGDHSEEVNDGSGANSHFLLDEWNSGLDVAIMYIKPYIVLSADDNCQKIAFSRWFIADPEIKRSDANVRLR